MLSAVKMVSALKQLLSESPLEKDQGVILSEDGEIACFARLVKVKDMLVWYGEKIQAVSEMASLHAKTGKHYQLFRWWEIDGPLKIQAAVAKFVTEYQKDAEFRINAGKSWGYKETARKPISCGTER